MPSKQNLELKVGIFAFIAIIILTLAIFSISEVYFFRPAYFIKIQFSFASGIDVGAAVRVAGIEVGEVKDLELTYDKDTEKARVVLRVRIDKEVQIPGDSRAYVNVSGLIGEPYLEIVPGKDYTHLLKAGDTLAGYDPISSETLMEVLHKVGDNFDAVLNSMNEVLDEGTKEALKETVNNLRDSSASLKVILGRLECGEGKLGTWLKPRKKRRKKGTSK